nr:F420-0:Gamma-glutamyl ligase [uncultured bacterium]
MEAFIPEHIPSLTDGSVLVVTSKIVALAEERTAKVEDHEKLIRSESDLAIRTKYNWLTLKDGMVMSSAGIDESNANGKLILLPKDSFKAAEMLRYSLMARYRLTKLGVIITDSRVFPLRVGAMGAAIGYAGFHGLKDYRGTPDIFGRKIQITRSNVPDALAAAAVHLMGEGSEQRPLCVIEDAQVEFSDSVDRNELRISAADDLYKPLFDTLK